MHVHGTLPAAACPPKDGFAVIPDKNWVGSSGSYSGQTTFSAAEKICRANPQCKAFNSYGYYINGGISSFHDYIGLCIYVKH